MPTNILTQQLQGGNLLSVDSVSVPGGTLYIAGIKNGGVEGDPSMTFVPTGVPSPVRSLILTLGAADSGAPLTVTPGTPAGTVGIARTAGTSLQLAGEATSASAKTDKVLFEFNLPDSYIAGSNIPILINAVVTGAGTLTAASTTMTVAAYSVASNCVETALSVTAAVQIPATTAADLAFTVTGTGLTPGQRMVLNLTMLVTSSSGANTGYINSVRYQA